MLYQFIHILYNDTTSYVIHNMRREDRVGTGALLVHLCGGLIVYNIIQPYSVVQYIIV